MRIAQSMKANLISLSNSGKTEFHLPDQFPDDDLSPLHDAFDLIGEHVFSVQWPSGMTKHVRLGRRRVAGELYYMGKWVQKALVQCVQNGWLPLIYFKDGRRIWYFDSSNEPCLYLIYPQPTDESFGQIELEGGAVYECMVDLRGFRKLLRAKFGDGAKAKPGRKRGYPQLDIALTNYFEKFGRSDPAKDVITYLEQILTKADWPRSQSTLYDRIREARDRSQRNSGNSIPN